MRIRYLLNKLKWGNEINFDEVEIWYIDRGAPGDKSVITGGDIEKIGRSFVHTKGKAIPFHRIIKITYRDRILFDRFRKNSPEPKM